MKTDDRKLTARRETGSFTMYNDLRVWWVPQAPCTVFEVPVPSVEVGAFQLLNNIKPDYTNAGGLHVFEDGEWVDWQDEETLDEDPQDVYDQPSLGWCAKLP